MNSVTRNSFFPYNMKFRYQFIVAIILIALFLLFGAYFILTSQAGIFYHFEGAFSNAPEDDAEFENQLRQLPGVFLVDVGRNQSGRDVHIIVHLGIEQNIWQQPPIPNFDFIAAQCGYKEQRKAFHHCRAVPTK